MTLISITLPSIYKDSLYRTLDNIRDETRSDYEVIVVSPFKVEYPNVVWIEETERKGCGAAHHRAAFASSGEFIVGFADDHVFVDGWDKLAIENFVRREKKFRAAYAFSHDLSMGPGWMWPPFCLGMRHTYPQHVGTEWGIYYPYFPFMRRSDVMRHGWISADYRTGFGDSDLGMRIWSAGGRCEFSDQGLIVVTADDGRKNGALFTEDDMALFLKRWGPHYGGDGWDTSHIRGFNLDIIPSEFPEFAIENTVYHNDPEFAPIVKARLAEKEAARK